LFRARGQVDLQAKSTAQSANREKSANLAFEPNETSSPGGPAVPDSGQMRVFHTVNERTPKTEDSLAEGVEFELSGDFLNVSKSCKSVKKF
jgi:hypothetical protein